MNNKLAIIPCKQISHYNKPQMKLKQVSEFLHYFSYYCNSEQPKPRINNNQKQQR